MHAWPEEVGGVDVEAVAYRFPGRRGAGAPVPEHVWKRFTPESIDRSKCLARTWNGGRGGQCDSRPCRGRDVCRLHTKYQKHGLVTGAIPLAKLRGFEEKADKERVGVEKLGGDGEGCGAQGLHAEKE